jgi:hypothetical protein
LGDLRISKIQMVEAIVANFKVTERKTTTKVGEFLKIPSPNCNSESYSFPFNFGPSHPLPLVVLPLNSKK